MFATITGPLPPLPIDGATADGATLEDRLRAVLALQVAAGIGLLTDGGIGDAAADPVERWRTAQRLAGDHPVKAVLAGPLRAAGTAGPTAALAAAEALRQRIAALAAAGCPFVQIDEAAPATEPPAAGNAAARDAATERLLAAHARLLDGVADRTHLHLALAAGAERVGERLYQLPYRSFGFDLINGPDDWRLLVLAPADRGVVCGAIDPASPGSGDIETAIWAAGYAASTRGRGLDRVGLTTAPGLERLSPGALTVKLRLLGEAARLAGAPRSEVEAIVDPRATVGPRRHP